MPVPKLGVALVIFGLLLGFAAWALGVMLVQEKAKDVRRGWNLTPAVVAAVDLQPGTTLGDAQLELVSVPEQLVTSSLFKDKSALLGKQVMVALPKGTPIPAGAVNALRSCP